MMEFPLFSCDGIWIVTFPVAMRVRTTQRCICKLGTHLCNPCSAIILSRYDFHLPAHWCYLVCLEIWVKWCFVFGVVSLWVGVGALAMARWWASWVIRFAIIVTSCCGVWGPLQYKFLESDPGYLSCSKSTCQQTVAGVCVVQTCSGSVSFRLINIRTDLTFVLFSGGLTTPCLITATAPLAFANPKSPLSGHLSSVDSTGTQVRSTC